MKAVGISQVEGYCSLVVHGDKLYPLQCSPLQFFYRVRDDRWVQAYKLRVGDLLLCADSEYVEISDVEFVHKPASLYTLEVKHAHTFVVGRHRILAHNMLLPISAAVGFTLPFDLACSGASAGVTFGPIGICAGVVVGCIAGSIVYACSKTRTTGYEISFDLPEITKFIEYNKKEDNVACDDAQALGKPTENDGFVPKKNWDGKKVKHPKTGQVGWPDGKGSVWVPTGVGPLAHRGPHWDVIDRKGRHKNVLPGGKVC